MRSAMEAIKLVLFLDSGDLTSNPLTLSLAFMREDAMKPKMEKIISLKVNVPLAILERSVDLVKQATLATLNTSVQAVLQLAPILQF